MSKRKIYQTETNVYGIFSERLVYVMEIRDIPTQELADRLFVSRSTISDYRIGHRFPNIEQLFLLSTSLHVSTDYLLGLTDEIPFKRNG